MTGILNALVDAAFVFFAVSVGVFVLAAARWLWKEGHGNGK